MVEAVGKLLTGRHLGFFFDSGFIFVASVTENSHYSECNAEFFPPHATYKHHRHADSDGDDGV